MSELPTSPPEEIAGTKSQIDPFPWFREMRDSDRVRYDPSRDAWDVFGYETVTQVLGDHQRFSAATRSAAGVDDLLSETMMFSDPPRHDYLRHAAGDFFAPEAVEEYRPRIRQLTTTVLDQALDDGEMDVMADLAFPIAILVLTELLDVPGDDRSKIVEWSWGAFRGRDPENNEVDESVEYAQGLFSKLAEYFSKLIDARRENPGDGLVTHLLDVEVEGRSLTDREMIGICMNMLIAGSVPCYLITNAVYSFDQEDGLFEKLAGNPTALEMAIEEVLRYRSPTQAQGRVAAVDTELGGKQIEAGDHVVAWISAANRDGNAFDRPESFVYDRQPNKHIAFGTGLHSCLGARVARIEANAVLSELLDRSESIRIREDGLEPVETPAFILGLHSLPIQFE